MKRLWIALLSLMALCALTAGTAFAAGGHTLINDEIYSRLPSDGVVPKSSYTITTTGNLTTGHDVTFKVSGGDITQIEMAIDRPWCSTGYAEDVYCVCDTDTFTYNFMEPGNYYIFVNSVYMGVYTVTGDDLLERRIDSIMSQCKSSSAYDIALWAHDWLTLNTYYDSTQTYYSADYLLNENCGWGVCASYATAYYMMLESKGIPVEYISSNEINHAWNAVCVNGQWYEADVTWDTVGYAPFGQGTPSKDNLHFYFMLPDLLIQSLDDPHVGQPAKYETQCVSMEMNYYVQNGFAANWLEESIEAALGLKLTDSEETVTIQVTSQPEYLNSKPGWSYSIPKQICAAALAQILNGTQRITEDFRVYAIAASSDGAALTVTATSKEIDYAGMDVLQLPSNLTSIGSEAFADTAMQVIIIPESVTRISSDAFDSCKNLKYIVNHSALTITPPDGVEVIQQ